MDSRFRGNDSIYCCNDRELELSGHGDAREILRLAPAVFRTFMQEVKNYCYHGFEYRILAVAVTQDATFAITHDKPRRHPAGAYKIRGTG